jgi:hypothetical protein
MSHPTFRVIIALYHNQPTCEGTVVNANRVSAQLTYEVAEAPDRTLILPRALWFPGNASTVDFRYNDHHGFIIAVVDSEIIAIQDRHYVELGVTSATVNVRFVLEEDGSMIDCDVFDLSCVNDDVEVLRRVD